LKRSYKVLKTGVTPSLSMIQGPLPRYQISAETTALVIVDMQAYAGSRESGIGATLREKGIEAEFAYYFDRVDQIIPNIQRIMAECRERGVEVVHLTSESYTDDCRDFSHEWKKQRLYAPRGTNPIDPRLAPVGDEIVIRKLVTGGFDGSNIDFVLRNMNISTLIIVGVELNQCVENTVRGASMRGYDAIVVSDGTAAYTPEWQRFGLEVMADQFANVWDTAEVLSELQLLSARQASDHRLQLETAKP
jgi:nicotinamidase-related amidase